MQGVFWGEVAWVWVMPVLQKSWVDGSDHWRGALVPAHGSPDPSHGVLRGRQDASAGVMVGLPRNQREGLEKLIAAFGRGAAGCCLFIIPFPFLIFSAALLCKAV